jgi:hypothetical protein
MGTTAIKALLKLSSLFWRKRNRKKHGCTPKEKTYILKTKLDTEITTFRETIVQLKIPHTPVPLGYRHRVDAKLIWMIWDKSSMHLWEQGRLEAYINFHIQNLTQNTQPSNQQTTTREPSTTDPPPEETPPYRQP